MTPIDHWKPVCLVVPVRAGRRALLAACLLLSSLTGCAALTNPTANGIPVREVPPELLGKARQEEKLIPLNLLRQDPPEQYLLAKGDILGVWIEGVLGEVNQAPPVQQPLLGNLPPSIGYPVPVREDGTLALPLIPPLKVQGLTLPAVEKEIFKAYTVTKKILNPEAARIIVTLQRPRHTEVLVIREDSANLAVGDAGVLGGSRRGTGKVVDLPAYKNDVLNALAQTGGLPGQDARNEVFILRSKKSSALGGLGIDGSGPVCQDPKVLEELQRKFPAFEGDVIRIPLRLRPEEPIPFRPADVLLYPGDIIYIRSRDAELFYTAGLLGSGEYVLPRDYDLDVLQAVARVHGPLLNGAVNQNNLSGNILGTGIGTASPSLLSVVRRTAGGGQIDIVVDLNRALRDPRERILVQPGDLLVLQETPGEAINRYLTSAFHYNFLGTFIRQRDLTATATLTGP